MGFNFDRFGRSNTMYDRMKALVGTIGNTIVTFGLALFGITANAAIYAFPMRALWLWFVVPAAHFAPLTYLGTMGMAVFANVVLVNVQHSKSEGYLADLFTAAITATVVYGVGFGIHYFM